MLWGLLTKERSPCIIRYGVGLLTGLRRNWERWIGTSLGSCWQSITRCIPKNTWIGYERSGKRETRSGWKMDSLENKSLVFIATEKLVGSWAKASGMEESEECKLLWNLPIQTDHKTGRNKLVIVFIDKNERGWLIINIACPFRRLNGVAQRSEFPCGPLDLNSWPKFSVTN